MISVSLANKYRRLLLGGEVSEARQTEYSRKLTIYDALPGKRKVKGRNAHALERRTVEGSELRVNIRKCSVEAWAAAVPAAVPKDAFQAVAALHHGESTFSAI